MNNLLRNYSWILLAVLAIFTVATTVAGCVISFSPVPFWDMWDGYIGFYTNVQHGDTGYWWAQHNEHRILFARLLFWTDLHFLGGTTAFLIAFNLLLALSASLLFMSIARSALSQHPPALRYAIFALSLILCFSWAQNENFNWAFQPQFFAAQFFPLLSLYLLYRSTKRPAVSNALFLLAAIVGLGCAGTMANGVLALPLMALYAIPLRLGLGRIVFLFLLSAIELFAYFHNYNPVPGHGSLRQALLSQPLDLLRYVFIYLGSPLYYLTRSDQFAKYAGLFLTVSSFWFAFSTLRRWRSEPLALCLLFYLAYIGATAFGTAGGRLNFGLDQALSSRYTTPAIMAWMALLILYARQLGKFYVTTWPLQLLLTGALLSIVPLQKLALMENSTEKQEKMFAALSLEMDIHDDAAIKHIYPNFQDVQRGAAFARSQDWSIFGNPALLGVHERIGQPLLSPPAELCLGYIDSISSIEGASDYVRVDGWMFSKETGKPPFRIWISDAGGTIVGFALAGFPRPDVAAVIDRGAGASGFRGYIKASATHQKLLMIGEKPGCSLTLPSK